jgi:hypothetical protein
MAEPEITYLWLSYANVLPETSPSVEQCCSSRGWVSAALMCHFVAKTMRRQNVRQEAANPSNETGI